MNSVIKVYIRTNDKSLVTEINSDVFLIDTEGYIQIDQGQGNKFAHAQNCYLDKPLYDKWRRNNYIYEKGMVRTLIIEEKEDVDTGPTDEELPINSI